MENNDLLRRVEDLARRCRRTGEQMLTGFLTPAERYQTEAWARAGTDCRLVFSGGREACERTVCFFLPYYEDGEPDISGHIKAIKFTAPFGDPGHRDYLGAALGMGVKREWIGDIWTQGKDAYMFCLQSVQRHLLTMDKVGRWGVKAQPVELGDVPELVRNAEKVSFSVMSMRLDAVTAGMFRLSRTEAAKQIAAGNVRLNYAECLKADAPVKEGDVISLRHAGKGSVTGTGGTSRKGRLFVYTEILK